MDIDDVLATYAKEQAEFEKVNINVTEKPPSKRINGTMVASPIQGKHELFLFGGETTERKQVKSGNPRLGTQSSSLKRWLYFTTIYINTRSIQINGD